MDYICTNFGVDSSRRLPFRARTQYSQTHKNTNATDHHIPRLVYRRRAEINSWYVVIVTQCHCYITHLIWPHFILTECMRERSQSQQTGSLHSAWPSSSWMRPIAAHSVLFIETYKHSYRQACTLGNEWPWWFHGQSMHVVDDIHCRPNCISVTHTSSLLSACGNRQAALICLSGPANSSKA